MGRKILTAALWAFAGLAVALLLTVGAFALAGQDIGEPATPPVRQPAPQATRSPDGATTSPKAERTHLPSPSPTDDKGGHSGPGGSDDDPAGDNSGPGSGSDNDSGSDDDRSDDDSGSGSDDEHDDSGSDDDGPDDD